MMMPMLMTDLDLLRQCIAEVADILRGSGKNFHGKKIEVCHKGLEEHLERLKELEERITHGRL